MNFSKPYKPFAVLSLFCLLVLGHFACKGQSVWKNMKSSEQLADDYYDHGQFIKALELYQYLEEQKKGTEVLELRIGRINYYLKNYNEAVKYLEQYQLKNPLTEDDLLLYANALTASRKYSQAIEAYTLYMEKYGENDWLTMKTWRLNNLNYLYEDSLIYSVSPLIAANSEFSDIPAAYYNDGMLLISDRTRSFALKRHLSDRTGRSTYALYYTSKISPSIDSKTNREVLPEVSNLIKAGGYHLAGLTFDKNKLIYARNVPVYSKTEAQPLKLFEKSVQSHGEGKQLKFTETKYSVKNPYLSPDGLTLYFAADLPEGLGGFDLYKCTRVNDSWSTPENLGEKINTPEDEAFPFVNQSGFLYFSSDGLPGFGGYDLFKVELNSDAEPQNLGYPVNSSADDFALILNERGDRGHFASNRKHGGLDDDIYVVEIDLQKYPLTITGLLKLKNLDAEPVLLPNTTFEVVDNNSKEVVYTSRSDKNGGFSIDIPYASQFFIRLQMGDADPLVVSLEIPKNKDKQANHEIVVVSSRYIPIEQTDQR